MTTFIVKFREPVALHGDTTLIEMFDSITIGVFVDAVSYDHAVELARDQAGVDDNAAVAEVRPLCSQVAA